MDTRNDDVQRLLSACTNAGELRQTLESLCADFGYVLSVTVLCGSESALKKQCVVDLMPGDSDAERCARRLGARIFGDNSLILDLVPHPEFACPRGLAAPPPADCCCAAR